LTARQSDGASADIETYLRSHEQRDLLRFITCGSVDDGKSTLIGRLLYEAKLIFEDQLAALAVDSKKMGTRGGELDFALLLDGLFAEREQGITIDVAYRFFSTARRKFIVADTPGHEQYTRNMITGASTAELAVILIDAGRESSPRPGATATSCRSWGFGASCWPSTRWIWWDIPATCSRGLKGITAALQPRSGCRRPRLFRSPPFTATTSCGAVTTCAGTKGRR
jgi:Elongation factor Tu GTP binding domain